MYKYVLFDLDGTLTDPKEGITKCVQYALKEEFGIEEKNLDNLEHFIGPPLKDSFMQTYGLSEEEAERGVKKYRERYSTIGIKENEIYVGMADMLKSLKEQDVMLAVASSKPQKFVEIILDYFHIAEYFTVVVGSGLDGSLGTKTEVVEEALRQLKVKSGRRNVTEQAVMVGDRKFDVEGAAHFQMDSIAVSYGYAPEGELKQAGPTYIVDSVPELEEVITGQKGYMKYKDKPSFIKTFEILYPLLLFWAIEVLVVNVGYYLVAHVIAMTTELRMQWNVYLNALAAVATWPFLAKLYETSVYRDASLVITRRKMGRLKKEGVLIVAYAMSLALGLNFLFSYFKLENFSKTFQNTASTQQSVSLFLGLVIYGLLTPFTEELIFRGVIYNRIKKYFPVTIAIFLNAVVFGCYHGNLVQIIYAFMMGLVMAYLYEIYGHLLAPVLFHMAANMIVFAISKMDSFSREGVPVYYGIMLLFVACIVTFWYGKQNKLK